MTQVARELGVQYVLEGSVRKSGDKVRITAQLIDASTGHHIWADRYDRSLEDVFAVQDEISEAITTAVAPAFISAEFQRAGRKAPDNLDAWDYAKMAQRLSPRDPVQSMWSFARTGAEFGAGDYEESLKWAKVTTEAMPDFPAAWRYYAASLGHLDRLEEAREATERLLATMPHDNLQLVRQGLPSVRAERMDRFVDGLRKAGLPES